MNTYLLSNGKEYPICIDHNLYAMDEQSATTIKCERCIREKEKDRIFMLEQMGDAQDVS